MRIYKITNLINGKIYIGQTINDINYRFMQHCYYASTRHSAISKSINKYGKENFKIELIDECGSVEEMNEKEIYWIKELNSLSPNGYNLCYGGNGKGKHTPETIAKIQAGRVGFKQKPEVVEKLRKINTGKKMKPATLEKMRKRMIGNKYAEGTIISDDRKLEISKFNANLKPTGVIEYKGVYWSKIEKKYGSRFYNKSEKIWLGWFNESKNGAISWDIISRIKRIDYGYLNFPDKTIEELLVDLTEIPSDNFKKIINIHFNKEIYITQTIIKNKQSVGPGIRYINEKYYVRVRLDGKEVYAGTYNLIENAKIIYDLIAINRNSNNKYKLYNKNLNKTQLLSMLTEEIYKGIIEII